MFPSIDKKKKIVLPTFPIRRKKVVSLQARSEGSKDISKAENSLKADEYHLHFNFERTI